MSGTMKEELQTFYQAILDKEDWVHKVLDKKRLLLRKWAFEANLVTPDFDFDAPENASHPVVGEIWDMYMEALRIRSADLEIRLQTDTIPVRDVDFAAIDKDVRAALQYARGFEYAIREIELKDKVGVYSSDGIVPPSLHAELVSELDVLAAREPKDYHPGTHGKVQDMIHPSLYPFIVSVTEVIEGTSTPPLDEDDLFSTKTSINEHFEMTSTLHSEYAWIPSVFRVSADGKDVEIQSYINGLGPREQYPNIYRIIEKVFMFALPHFEKTVQSTFEERATPSVQRWWERMPKRWEVSPPITRVAWEGILAAQKLSKVAQEEARATEKVRQEAEVRASREKFAQVPDHDDIDVASQFYKGKDLKVIVKAANYLLKPGQAHEGTWHVEGMPHERIVASAIYYYDTDTSIIDKGLGLRRCRRDGHDFPSFDHSTDVFNFWFQEDWPEDADAPTAYEEDYPSDWEHGDEEDLDEDGRRRPFKYEMQQAISLGTVQTTGVNEESRRAGFDTGRMISFPNYLQHKVLGIENSAPLTAGCEHTMAKRKILCFFLVDDSDLASDTVSFPGITHHGLRNMSVLTTSDIPYQPIPTNYPTLKFLLPIACAKATRGKVLPAELVDEILQAEDVDFGRTRNEAEQYRRLFMADRGAVVKDEQETWQMEYSLCEH